MARAARRLQKKQQVVDRAGWHGRCTKAVARRCSMDALTLPVSPATISGFPSTHPWCCWNTATMNVLYKESGFPHGKDQWTSASGTCWAVMALSLALPSQQLESAR